VTRLALLAESLDPDRGGAERAVRAAAAALAAAGAEVAVYAPDDRLGPPAPPPVRSVGVPVPPGPRRRRPERVARALLAAARRDGGAAVACGKVPGCDLYWPHGGVHAAARRAAARAGRPAGLRRAAALGRRLRPVERSFDALEAEAAAACRSGAARFVALSERVRRDAAGDLDLPPGAVAVVRNGVDRPRFAGPAAPGALAARIGAPADATVGLLVAHAARLKGLDAAIAALPAVPGLHLAAVGAFRSAPFARLARRRGVADRVAFLGPAADPAPLYRGADLLIHPSRYDPCSLVVLEALAAGLPVVGSVHDGAAELVVAAGAGPAVDPDDPPALAAALAELTDPAARSRRAAAAAGFRRGWDDVARELLALVEARS